MKGQFKLVFNNQDCKYLLTDMIINTTNLSSSNVMRETIEGYDFSHIAEMDIITLAHKQNMSAFEWKINQLINKDMNPINKFPRNWRHPVNTKFICYRNN